MNSLLICRCNHLLTQWQLRPYAWIWSRSPSGRRLAFRSRPLTRQTSGCQCLVDADGHRPLTEHTPKERNRGDSNLVNWEAKQPEICVLFQPILEGLCVVARSPVLHQDDILVVGGSWLGSWSSIFWKMSFFLAKKVDNFFKNAIFGARVLPNKEEAALTINLIQSFQYLYYYIKKKRLTFLS